MDTDKRQDMRIIIHYESSQRLDSSYAPDFQRELRKKIIKAQYAVILDLSAVEFIDSSGLGAIIVILKSLPSKVELLLCGVGKNVKELFSSTGIDEILTLYPDIGSAKLALQEA